MLFCDDTTWIANDNRVIGYVEIDIRQRSDKHIITDMYFAYDTCVTTDPYIVSQDWIPRAFPSQFCTNGATMIQADILAQYSSSIDGNIERMMQDKAGPYTSVEVNIQSCSIS